MSAVTLTTLQNLIFKSSPKGTRGRFQGFLYLAPNTADCFYRRPLKFRHFQGGVEHSLHKTIKQSKSRTPDEQANEPTKCNKSKSTVSILTWMKAVFRKIVLGEPVSFNFLTICRLLSSSNTTPVPAIRKPRFGQKIINQQVF